MRLIYWGVIMIVVIFTIFVIEQKTGIFDYAHIAHCTGTDVYTPVSEDELIKIVSNTWPRKICIAGAKYSHGGQTMLDNAVQIDMRRMNKMVLLNQTSILVEAGATWKEVLTYLDQFGLSVAEMQSYSNFSVGGSISVNCHGRGINFGTVSDIFDNPDETNCS